MENTRINKDSDNLDEVELEYTEKVEIKKHYTPKAIKNEIDNLQRSIDNFTEQKAILEEQLETVKGEIKKIKNVKK